MEVFLKPIDCIRYWTLSLSSEGQQSKPPSDLGTCAETTSDRNQTK